MPKPNAVPNEKLLLEIKDDSRCKQLFYHYDRKVYLIKLYVYFAGYIPAATLHIKGEYENDVVPDFVRSAFEVIEFN